MTLLQVHEIPKPYLLFLGDDRDRHTDKIARGLIDWAREDCAAQYATPGNSLDLGLPFMTPAEAAEAGVKTMVIAVTNRGGFIPDSWHRALTDALDAGLDLASGMHVRLAEIDAVRGAAERSGRALHDVRHTAGAIPVASGADRPGRRALTVGTDCALGKKYTALAVAKVLQGSGRAATFRATGQTGILIAGHGIAVDAVKADFIAGAAELLTPANDPAHWDVVEGQGSIYHPAYSGVTLGLLHGAKPHRLILCHDPTRTHIMGYPDFPLPDLGNAISLYERLASLVSADCKVAGISLNTSKLGEEEARQAVNRAEQIHGLSATDPLRFGADKLAQALLSSR